MNAIFTNLMGKDITVKLYQVQELMSRPHAEKVPQRHPSQNSVVQVRHRLSQSLSNNNLDSVGKELEKLIEELDCSSSDSRGQ